jgi:hypothetical protein
VLQGGAAGGPAWSTLASMAVVADFDPDGGDRLRVSDAWPGGAGGAGATLGLLAGPDGAWAPLVFGGGPSAAQAALSPGLRLPAQPLPGLGAFQLFWIRAEEGGGPPAAGS